MDKSGTFYGPDATYRVYLAIREKDMSLQQNKKAICQIKAYHEVKVRVNLRVNLELRKGFKLAQDLGNEKDTLGLSALISRYLISNYPRHCLPTR